MRLTFDVFELEVVPNREDCSYDSIEVYDTYTSDDEHDGFHGRCVSYTNIASIQKLTRSQTKASSAKPCSVLDLDILHQTSNDL